MNGSPFRSTLLSWSPDCRTKLLDKALVGYRQPLLHSSSSIGDVGFRLIDTIITSRTFLSFVSG